MRDQREGLPAPWVQKVGDSYVDLKTGIVMIVVLCGNCGHQTAIPWAHQVLPKGICMPCVRQMRGEK